LIIFRELLQKIMYENMKWGGVGSIIYSLLSSVLEGSEWIASRSGRFTSGEYALLFTA
jgi:hypothetical protein